MKHAGPSALDRLQPLLAKLRARAALAERRRGVFYRAGGAFLHFHEDPAGLFADLKVAGRFVRRPVNTAAQRTALLARVRRLAG